MRFFWKLIRYLYVGSYATQMKLYVVGSFESEEHKKIIIKGAFFNPFMTVVFPLILFTGSLCSLYWGKLFFIILLATVLALEHWVVSGIFFDRKLYEDPITEFENMTEQERKSRTLSSMWWMLASIFGSLPVAVVLIIVILKN